SCVAPKVVGTYRSPAFPTTEMPEPAVALALLRCRSNGTPTGADYPNAGSSSEILLRSQAGSTRPIPDGQLATVLCSKLAGDVIIDRRKAIDATWRSGPVLSAAVSSLADRLRAKSIVVPLVSIDDICRPGPLGQPECEWTATEFAAFLFS